MNERKGIDVLEKDVQRSDIFYSDIKRIAKGSDDTTYFSITRSVEPSSHMPKFSKSRPGTPEIQKMGTQVRSIGVTRPWFV